MSANISTIITRMSHTELIARTEPIITAFTTGTPIPGPMPSFLLPVEELKAFFERFRAVHQGAETGNHIETAERNALRPAYNQAIIDLADFVELASRKDPTIPLKAGFEYFWRAKKSNTAHATSLASPSLTVVNEKERGTVTCKAGSVAGARSFHLQMTYGDPTVEANWGHADTSGGGTKLTVRNLEVGKTCSFRVRAVGTSEMGPWSNYVTITVT